VVIGYRKEDAHSADFKIKATRIRPKRSEHIFNRKYSGKKPADCCRLLPVVALIYSQLHHQCTMNRQLIINAFIYVACMSKNE
jgi:hypothetical protein